MKPIPIIDLFAGPGGLNEGFGAVVDSSGRFVFETALSVENDAFAHQTLELRALYRRMRKDERVSEYNSYVRGDITRATLFEKAGRLADEARREALLAALGESISTSREIEDLIEDALTAACTREFVLIGGPPCQAYSLVGRARRRNEDRHEFEKDPKQRLYREYLRIVRRFKPVVFLMENVPGLLSAKLGGARTFDLICEGLSGAGYDLHPLPESDHVLFAGCRNYPRRFIVDAEEYGVPQARSRVFILGLRSDLNLKSRALTRSTKPPVPIEDVIGDLPAIRSRLSREEDSGIRWRDEIVRVTEYKFPGVPDPLRRLLTSYAATLDPALPLGGRFIGAETRPGKLASWLNGDRIGGVLNHNSRRHMASDLRRYFFWATYGRIMGRSPALAEVPAHMRPNHLNVSGDATRLPFADRFRVQVAGRPSTTITSHIAKDGHYYIHYAPDQCRSLSVREAARLQTFPDGYFFEGPVTKQYLQVGNAVPPFLAKQIGDLVVSILK